MKIQRSIKAGVIAFSALVALSCEDDGAVSGVAVPQVASVAGVPAEIALTVGDTEELEIIVLDSNGDPISDPVLTFTSSDGAVATVDPAGVITAVGEGLAVVTVETAGLAAHVDVTVRATLVGPGLGPVVINPPSFGMEAGETVQLSVIVLDQDGREIPDAVVTFSSNDEDVATVDTEGLVKAISGPSTGPDLYVAVVTATSGGVSDSAYAWVRAPSTHVVIKPSETTISIGDRLQLRAIVLNENGEEVSGSELKVQWAPVCRHVAIGPQTYTTYCFEDVATVNQNGIVTGVGKGRLTVHAGWEPGGFGIDPGTAGWAVVTVE